MVFLKCRIDNNYFILMRKKFEENEQLLEKKEDQMYRYCLTKSN